VRADTGVEQGSAITPYYDPMIAKMITQAPTREAALDQLASALDRTLAAGPRTNLALLAALCRSPDFRAGQFDTGFIERNLTALLGEDSNRAAAAFGAVRLLAREIARIGDTLDRAADVPGSPWDEIDGFQLSGARTVALPLTVDDERLEAHISYGGRGPSVAVDGVPAALDTIAIEAADAVYVLHHGRQTVVRRADLGAGDLDQGSGDGEIKAPMHGKVLALLVQNGDRVEKGARLAIIEAMKMEHALTAPRAGRVTGLTVTAGSQLAEGAGLMTIEPIDE
jgi:3-methylcrotonyl-CoA carboxylase alpha subunit